MLLLLPLLCSELQPVREVKPSLASFSVWHMVQSRCFSPPFTALFWTASIRSVAASGQLWVRAVRCGRTAASDAFERMERGRKPEPDRNTRESGRGRPRGPGFIVDFLLKEKKKRWGGEANVKVKVKQMNRSHSLSKTLLHQIWDTEFGFTGQERFDLVGKKTSTVLKIVVNVKEMQI